MSHTCEDAELCVCTGMSSVGKPQDSGPETQVLDQRHDGHGGKDSSFLEIGQEHDAGKDSSFLEIDLAVSGKLKGAVSDKLKGAVSDELKSDNKLCDDSLDYQTLSKNDAISYDGLNTDESKCHSNGSFESLEKIDTNEPKEVQCNSRSRKKQTKRKTRKRTIVKPKKKAKICENRTDNEIPLVSSPFKITAEQQEEQERLYNRLKEASVCESLEEDASEKETEYDVPLVSSPFKTVEHQEEYARLYQKLRKESSSNGRSCKDKSEIKSSDVVRDYKFRSDWREQLLKLEMSHDHVDEGSCGEIDPAEGIVGGASDHVERSLGVANDQVEGSVVGAETENGGQRKKDRKGSKRRKRTASTDEVIVSVVETNWCLVKKRRGWDSNFAVGRSKFHSDSDVHQGVGTVNADIAKKKDLGDTKSKEKSLVRTSRRKKNLKSTKNESVVKENIDNSCESLDNSAVLDAKQNDHDSSAIIPRNLAPGPFLYTSSPSVQTKSRRKRKVTSKSNCKRKVDKHVEKQSIIKFEGVESEEVTREPSMLDLSLPTPRAPRVAPTTPKSVSFDANVDESDSDEDLPVGLTPMKLEKSFSENDIVWVKWKKWPHVPALVKKVYKKKKRLTCAVFGPTGFEDDFTMGYSNPGNVLSYCDPKKDQILTSSHLNEEDRRFFEACLATAENYLTKQAIKELGDTELFKENLEHMDVSVDYQEDIPATLSEREENCTEKTKSGKRGKRKRENSDCLITKVEKEKDGLSKRGQKRIEKMSEKTKPMTEFLMSETTKEFLVKIYNRTVPSELNDRFVKGTVRERAKMKHRGFGPLDDEEQIDSILQTYLRWLTEINNKPIYDGHYIFDVWIPEAVVFALKTLKGYGRKKAWEQFDKGVRRTKEELQIMHQDLLDGDLARKVSDKPKDFILK